MNLETLVAKAANYNLAKPPEISDRKDDAATLYLYDMVAPPGMGGISARDFVSALEKVKGAKTLHLRINSPGGAVFEAKTIYNALREFTGEKVAHVDGLAASAATFIAMAADHIITAPEATWFIHGAQMVTMGGEKEHADSLELIRMESANIRAIYAKRTGQPEEDLRAWMDAETFMSAAEAKDRGFTDEIAGEEEPIRVAAEAAPMIVALARETHRVLSDPDNQQRIDAARRRHLENTKRNQELSSASVGGSTGQPAKTSAK